jgi:hypothetical protein
MNERIRQLAEQCYEHDQSWTGVGQRIFNKEKFAQLIVKECALQCIHNEDMDLIEKHFGVAESSAQAEQEAAAFIAAEDKKVASRYGYVPKLHPSEWKD